MQVLERKSVSVQAWLLSDGGGDDAAGVARAFVDAQAVREAILRDMRAAMAARRVEGGETAMLGLLMALAVGELRASMLARATRNGSYGIQALVRGGWLEPLDGLVCRDRRVRQLRLTAIGEEAALALADVIRRHGEGVVL